MTGFLKTLPSWLIILICSTALSQQDLGTTADEPTAQISVHLEYPTGRFRETDAPKFFKWSYAGKPASFTLKLFRLNSDGSRSTEEPAQRFDVLGTVESMSLPAGVVRTGRYNSVLEAYDETSPVPVSSDQASFEIAQLKPFDLGTKRVGLFAGASRGSYVSNDPSYGISFDTTPSLYGALIAGSQRDRNWQVTISSSDFILKGSVFRTFDLLGEFALPLNDENARFRVHLGPTVHALFYPQARSMDGATLQTKNLSVGALGMSLSAQMKLDQYLQLYSKVGLEASVIGTQAIDFSNPGGALAAHAGVMFGQFWPLGLGVDLGYDFLKVSTKDKSDSVNIRQDRLSFEFSVLYAL